MDARGRTKHFVVCSDPDPGDTVPTVLVCEPSAFNTPHEAAHRQRWPIDELTAL
jgi:hypothetical protein